MSPTPDYDAALREVNAQLLDALVELERVVRRLQIVLELAENEDGRGW